MSWMRLPDEYCGDESTFVILPIPYEENPTYGEGASKGPEAIIKASEHLEYYDERFVVEPFIKGIKELTPLTLPSEPEKAVEKIANTVKGLGDKFVLSLGGDHAVTIGIVKGLEEKHKDFSLLILDAHSDFRESWNGSRKNHACVARRIVGKHKVGIIGVRSQDIDEAEALSENENVKIVKAYEYSEDELEKILNFLGGKVYLSIDVDVFDPGFLRNTGTPEPGGLDWQTVIAILQQLFAKKNVIGADIVEFAPQGGEWNYRAEVRAGKARVQDHGARYNELRSPAFSRARIGFRSVRVSWRCSIRELFLPRERLRRSRWQRSG